MTDARVLVIDAAVPSLGASLEETWSARELVSFLVWRDLKVRYKHTALGALWAVIQPFTTMVVFSLFFGRLAAMPSDGMPYPVFSFAALVPWTYFSTSIAAGAASLAGNQHLISKVYFPRLVFPLAAIATPLVDAAIALAMLAMLLAWFGIAPGPPLAALPLFAALAVAAASAAAIWLAALGAQYRDVRYIVPFLVQLWLFLSPVAYPTTLVPAAWRPLYGLNPMATVIDGFRWTLLQTPPPSPAMIASSVAMVALALWTGWRYFRRTESRLADFL